MVFIDLQAVLCLQVDFAAKFSIEAKQRIMPGLRVLATAFAGIPGIIPLQGGLPPSEAFPLTGISLRLRDGSTIDINEQSEVWQTFHNVALQRNQFWYICPKLYPICKFSYTESRSFSGTFLYKESRD